MIRKKTALSMDSRYSMMIENAFNVANPPQIPAMPQIVRPPLHEYMHKLLFSDLCKNNTEKVLRQIRKLDWNDPEVSSYAIRCLGAIWNLKYYNIRYGASLLAGLVSYHVSLTDFCHP
jgi:regulator of nonsense transcripts 2